MEHKSPRKRDEIESKLPVWVWRRLHPKFVCDSSPHDFSTPGVMKRRNSTFASNPRKLSKSHLQFQYTTLSTWPYFLLVFDFVSWRSNHVPLSCAATARRSTPTNSAAGQNASDHEDEEGWNSSADDTSTLTRNRFRHTTYCCSCSEPRSESRAIGMCDGCPRIVCRDCGTRLLCVKIPDGDAPDVILPSGKCFCRWRDFQFPKPPEGVQPEAHLLRHLVLHDLSAQFRDEVDVTENSGYLGVITREEMMDLSTISNKVRHRKAWTKRERSTFRLEVQQIWRNCWKFAGYDPESNAPIPGIVSCTLILRAMVDKFYKMHMPELTSAYGEGSSLHGKPLIKEVRRKTTHGGPPQSSVSRPDPHVAPSSSFDSDEETESEYEFEQPTELSVVRRKRKCPDGTLAIERGERYGDIVGEANANELDETTSTAGAARDDTVPESQGLRENLCRMADIGERLVRGEL